MEGTGKAYVFYQPAQPGADSAFLEIYWQVNPLSLTYQHNGGMLQSQLLVQTSITGPGDFTLQDAFLAATTPFDATTSTPPPVYFRQRYRLPTAGTYYLSLQVSEKEKPESRFILQDSVLVSLEKKPSFSGILSLDTLYKADPPGPYTKAGMERIARPIAFADSRQLNLTYYSELYHAPAAKTILQVTVSRKRKSTPLPQMVHTDTLHGGPLTPVAGTFQLQTLPSGNYYLNEALFDTTGKVLAEQQLFFQISNPRPVAPDAPADSAGNTNTPLVYLDISKTFVAKYTDEEKRAILKMIRPVADETELANINIMLSKGSEPLHTAYFIYNFFLKRNPNKPDAAWKDYASRVREVNKLFAEPGRMGYETDRGNIYLKYGAPEERLKVPSEAGALPYEVWRYKENPELPSLAFFLFYQDGFAIGEYRLLHSSVPGETYNARWGEILFKGNEEKLKNSRAWRLMNNE